MSCMSCVCTTWSWFSHAKTICSLHVFFFSLLYFFSWVAINWKYRMSVKYSNGSSVFLIPFHEFHELYFCTRGAPFSYVKIICNLHVIVSSLLYFFSMGLYGKYRWSVKYSTGSLVFISLPSVAWLVFVLRGHGFHMWKPFAACTYFFFRDFIYLSWVGTGYTGGP